MSTSSSIPAASRSKPPTVFITAYEGSIHLAKKLLESAKACEINTDDFVFVMTDGSHMPGFKNITLNSPQLSPVAPNRAFMAVAKACYMTRTNFLFLDSDCTFLQGNAIEKLHEEFDSKARAILAKVFCTPGQPWCFNGNGYYRWDTLEIFDLVDVPIPDYYSYDNYLSQFAWPHYIAPTNLIFQTAKGTKEATTLDGVPPEAVLHHPCVDGSIADLVVERYARA